MAGCGGCGRGGSAVKAPKWRWVSTDGQQVVGNLTEVEAKRRAARKGGEAQKQ